MSGILSFTPERDWLYFRALDRSIAANSVIAYTRFSDYANYRIVLQNASTYHESCLCFWRDADEMCALLSGAARHITTAQP